MARAPKVDPTEAKHIAARMLAMPPDPHPKKGKVKPVTRTTGKGRARVGKAGG